MNLCKRCIEQNIACSIYLDYADPGKHLTGYIDACSENSVLIRHISPDGFYDGFVLIHVENIERMDLAGRYEKKIGDLYDYRKQTHPHIEAFENDLLSTVIQYSIDHKLVVTAELTDELLSGFILNYDHCALRIAVVDEFGQAEGESVILLENVLSFSIDTLFEQNLKLLNENLPKYSDK